MEVFWFIPTASPAIVFDYKDFVRIELAGPFRKVRSMGYIGA
jgi:hypothetical protein